MAVSGMNCLESSASMLNVCLGHLRGVWISLIMCWKLRREKLRYLLLYVWLSYKSQYTHGTMVVEK